MRLPPPSLATRPRNTTAVVSNNSGNHNPKSTFPSAARNNRNMIVSAYMRHLQDKQQTGGAADRRKTRAQQVQAALHRQAPHRNYHTLAVRPPSHAPSLNQSPASSSELTVPTGTRTRPAPLSAALSTTSTYVSSSSSSCESTASPAPPKTFPISPEETSVVASVGTSMAASVSTSVVVRATMTPLHQPTRPDCKKKEWFSSPADRSMSERQTAAWMEHFHSGKEEEKKDDDESNQQQQDEQDLFLPNYDIDALIAETSLRWRTSVEQIVENTATRKKYTPTLQRSEYPPTLQRSEYPPTLQRASSVPATTPTPNTRPDFIIQQQQAEIEALRAQLGVGMPPTLTRLSSAPNTVTPASSPASYAAEQHKYLQERSLSMLASSASPTTPYHHYGQVFPASPLSEEEEDEEPTEQIDDIPVEHIEVHMDEVSRLQEPDDLTVWSGWTQPRPPTPQRPPTPVQRTTLSRPEADDAASAVSAPKRRVKEYALQLTAANGTVRQALYSGPIAQNGQVTGQGSLKFVETGDLYWGHVVNGEMHGLGTYTFRSGRASLKGVFSHNVFLGAGTSLEC